MSPSPAADEANDGVVRLPSSHGVVATLDRLEALLKERGVLIFARIDFSGDAARAGLALSAEQQLIFGNPKAGTPLMAVNPAAALDLPIRAVCWQDSTGQTWLAYNAPDYVVRRHGLPPELSRNLAAVVPLLEKAAAPG
ncbi:MAG TPA: DUF302 domain-containing protein [Steroidobacteraceae bacterium]|jgi:uncharacterized protein (DUF302 family)